MFLLKFLWWLILLIIKIDILFVILTFFIGIYEALNDEDISKEISFNKILWGLFSEIFASIVNLFVFPFSFYNISRLFSTYSDEGIISTPVLLIHPYFGNYATLWFYLFKFKRAGFENVYSINLRPRTGSLHTFLEQIDQKVNKIFEETGEEKIVLLGHSMGGLLARIFALQNEEKIGAVVTLGSPHYGSKLAVFGIGVCAREMEPESELLKEIKGEFPDVPFLSVYSVVDNLALPQRTAIIPQSEKRVNYCAPPLGHLALLYSSTVADVVTGFVRSKISEKSD